MKPQQVVVPELSLRDWIAMAATEEDIKSVSWHDTSREDARYKFADKMLKARKAKE